jgi:hypothetical protein
MHSGTATVAVTDRCTLVSSRGASNGFFTVTVNSTFPTKLTGGENLKQTTPDAATGVGVQGRWT